jgi:hypothetical protein
MKEGRKAYKILFVAFPFSIHTVRWISQLAGEGMELHLYSSHRGAVPHAQLPADVVFHPNGAALNKRRTLLSKVAEKIIKKKIESPEEELSTLIMTLQPDVIHSMESQHAGYLVSAVKAGFPGAEFPFWIHSNWGIDLHFFGRLQAHTAQLHHMLAGIDLLLVEGRRDEVLAMQHGYTKQVLTFPSVGGGFQIPEMEYTPPAARKIILVKGTQDVVRRGLCAIRALERCAPLLNGYKIIMYSSCIETRTAAELFKGNTGMEISILENTTQEEMLALNAAARISLCTNLSDGLPNAMLEAMMTGAFPIQSDTCISEGWIEEGKTGFLVPPEDPEIIAQKITEALTNDRLVDEAAAINMKLIRSKLAYGQIRTQVLRMYQSTAGKAQQYS